MKYNNNTLKAAFYGRYSTDLQKETSIADQKSLCEREAHKQGWMIAKSYADKAETGRSMNRRPQLIQLLEDATKGHFQVVVVESVDRIARNQADMHRIFQDLSYLGIGIFCASIQKLISGVELTLAAYLAEQFSVDLGKKVSRGQRGAVSRGLICGSIPYGYSKTISLEKPKGGRGIDTAESQIVRRIYDLFAAGVPGLQIVAQLNAERVPPPSGKKEKTWIASALFGKAKAQTGILRNPIYTGRYIYGKETGKTNPKTGGRTATPTNVEDQMILDVPDLRIIDENTWSAVQRRLALIASSALPRRRAAKHLFSGKAICGLCGKPYTVADRTKLACSGRIGGRICNNRRRLDRAQFERFLLASLVKHLTNPLLIDEYIKEFRREHAVRQADWSRREPSVKKDISRTKGHIDALCVQLASTELLESAKVLLRAKLNDLSVELQRLEELANAKPVAPTLLNSEIIADRFCKQVHKLGVELEGNGPARTAAREAIRSLVDKIVITPQGLPSDRRGGGPVSIALKGPWISFFANCADDSGRMALLESGSTFQQHHANGIWRLFLDFPNIHFDPKKNIRHFVDTTAIFRALSEASGPITVVEMMAFAFKNGLSHEPEGRLKQRFIKALKYLCSHDAVIRATAPASRNRYVWSMKDRNSPVWDSAKPPLKSGYVSGDKIVEILNEALGPLTAKQIAAELQKKNGLTIDLSRSSTILTSVKNRLVYHRNKGHIRQTSLPGDRAKGWSLGQA